MKNETQYKDIVKNLMVFMSNIKLKDSTLQNKAKEEHHSEIQKVWLIELSQEKQHRLTADVNYKKVNYQIRETLIQRKM